MAEQSETASFGDASYAEQREVRDGFAEYLKSGSLYQKHALDVMPDEFAQIVPDLLYLYCDHCERESPYRAPSYGVRARLQPEADVG